MTWNTLPEIVALIVVLVISVYSWKSRDVPSFKNRMFRACLATTIAASVANLVSAYLIMYAPQSLWALTWAATAAHFALTPFLAAMYFYYAAAVVSEARPISRVALLLCALPCLAYALCVVANAATGWFFFIDDAGVYYRGPYYHAAYAVAYFYCMACILVVAVARTSLRPDARKILVVFPLLAVVVVFVQQLFPNQLLSGSAAACTLLIIYLYLQNKRLSIDLLTGIPNRQEFLSMVSLLHDRNRPFSAVLVSLSNFKFINDRFGNDNGDRLLQEFAGFLDSIKGRANLYRYGGDEFAFVLDGRSCEHADLETATRRLLDDLKRCLGAPWHLGEHAYSVNFVMGTVAYPAVASNPHDVTAALEYSVERAKDLEPGVVCTCSHGMIDEIHRRSAIADILRKAIATRSLSVQFQPIWEETAG